MRSAWADGTRSKLVHATHRGRMTIYEPAANGTPPDVDDRNPLLRAASGRRGDIVSNIAWFVGSLGMIIVGTSARPNLFTYHLSYGYINDGKPCGLPACSVLSRPAPLHSVIIVR